MRWPALDRRFSIALVCLALVASVAFVYAGVGGHDFVNFDDGEYVYENAQVRRGLTLDTARWAFRSLEVTNWHPVTWLSHLADVSAFGMDPGAHHLVSVAIHAANAMLLFAALLSLSGSLWASALAAALFALHPLHVESVAWISERKDLLSFSFAALTLWAYAAYVHRRTALRYAAVVACFALGLMAKPMLVTLPLVLLLLDAWPLRRLALGRRAAAGESKAAPWLEKIPLLLLSGASACVTVVAQRRGGAVVALDDAPVGLRVANALVSYAQYVRQTVWPAGLSVFYPFPESPYPAWVVGGAALLVLALSAVAAAQLRARPHLAVGWAWFLGTLVPVIGLVQVGGHARADRYTYLPLVGLFVAAAWLVDELARRTGAVGRVAGATVAVLVALAVVARGQVAVWKDSRILFEHAAAVAPGNWLAHTNLGEFALHRGDLGSAIAHFVEAERLKSNPVTKTNLGTALATAGRREDAAALFERALSTDGSYASAWFNLGLLRFEEGRLDEARAAFERAHRIAPQDLRTAYQLALAQLSMGDAAAGIRTLRAVLDADPEHVQALTALGIALAREGDLDEAVTALQASERLRPGDPLVRNALDGVLRDRARPARPEPAGR